MEDNVTAPDSSSSGGHPPAAATEPAEAAPESAAPAQAQAQAQAQAPDPDDPAQPEPAQAQQVSSDAADAAAASAEAGAGAEIGAGAGAGAGAAAIAASALGAASGSAPDPGAGSDMAAPKPVPENEHAPSLSSPPPSAAAATNTTTIPGHEAQQHPLRQSLTHESPQQPQQSPQHPPPPPQPAHEPSVPHFVAPLSYLRPKTQPRASMASPPPEPKPPSPLDKEQSQGLKAIRNFLKVRTSYDVLPLSFRLIVLDTDLLIKKTLNILIQNAIVSAPLWDSHTGRFAGLLTSTDYMNVIQYYCQFPDEMSKLDQFRLSSLRDIEKAIGAIPIETVSVHPSRPLYEACRRMLSTRARRIPLVDVDDETGQETVVSVITQYRILKFIAVNNEPNTILLKKTIRELKLGTYGHLATTHMGSTVLEAVSLMVRYNISCIPVVDGENKLLNAFEAVDVIPCIKGGVYEELKGTVGEALGLRPEDSPGIYTCTEEDRLDSIFETIRKSRVHRLIVVDDDNKLKGVISLSDILKYVLIHGDEDVGQ